MSVKFIFQSENIIKARLWSKNNIANIQVLRKY